MEKNLQAFMSDELYRQIPITPSPRQLREALYAAGRGIQPEKLTNYGILNGKLAVALLYSYLNRFEDNDQFFQEQAGQLVEEVFTALNEGDTNRFNGYALASGYTGLGMCLEIMRRDGFIDFQIDELLSPLDELIYECALADITLGRFDFLHQAGGAIQYFSSREPNTIIKQYLQTLCNELIKRAVWDEKGFRYQDQLLDTNSYNLGLAHGLSGLIMVLANAYTYLDRPLQVGDALIHGVNYLLRYHNTGREEGYLSSFPITIDRRTESPQYFDRLAWCYGDLNPLLCLYRVGLLMNRSDYINYADRLGQQTVIRTDAMANHIDYIQFCHGYAGLAQVYHSLYQLSGRPMYANSHHYWLYKTSSEFPKAVESKHYQNHEHELLEGLVGSMLVILTPMVKGPVHWPLLFLL